MQSQLAQKYREDASSLSAELNRHFYDIQGQITWCFSSLLQGSLEPAKRALEVGLDALGLTDQKKEPLFQLAWALICYNEGNNQKALQHLK